MEYEIAWPSANGSTEVRTNMDSTDVSIGHFRTPATLGAGQGSVGISETDGTPLKRKGALNFTPGDLTTQIGPDDQSGVFNGDTNPVCGFAGQPHSGHHGGSGKNLVLEPDTDYYINSINQDGSGSVVVTLAIHNI